MTASGFRYTSDSSFFFIRSCEHITTVKLIRSTSPSTLCVGLDGWRELRIIAAAVVRHSETSAPLLLVCCTCARLLEYTRGWSRQGSIKWNQRHFMVMGFRRISKWSRPLFLLGGGVWWRQVKKKKEGGYKKFRLARECSSLLLSSSSFFFFFGGVFRQIRYLFIFTRTWRPGGSLFLRAIYNPGRHLLLIHSDAFAGLTV